MNRSTAPLTSNYERGTVPLRTKCLESGCHDLWGVKQLPSIFRGTGNPNCNPLTVLASLSVYFVAIRGLARH